ncbi:MAG: flagellar hook-basal body complex protein FliE [Myxococcota bacterium]
MIPIQSLGVETIRPPDESQTNQSDQATGVDGSRSFSSALEAVRESLEEAEVASSEAMVGDGQIHTAMIAMTRADLTFRFAAQMRNKVVEAYREMMSLQF